MARTFLSGADLVLPDRIATGHTLVVEGDRIADIISGPRTVGPAEIRVDLTGRIIAPGFIDVHVHGVLGTDVLFGPGSVATVAERLPRWGVTAFCPTTIACGPESLATFLDEVRELRVERPHRSTRVLPAHLESNFLNPEYRGAQPLSCLRLPTDKGPSGPGGDAFTGAEILDVIDRHRPDVGIMTIAPELDGGIALVRSLRSAGIYVSIGHSGATFEQAQEAVSAGATQATHLFNQMSPLRHREPGLVGAMLAADEIATELICDGSHVHPSVMRTTIRAKGPSRIMAITDGTAGSGLPRGSRSRLGDWPIIVEEVARLEDGTVAGSVLTMDRAFAVLVTNIGVDLRTAVEMCATTPARELKLHGFGVLAAGAVADLVVLDSHLKVQQTWIDGQVVFQS